MRTYAEVKQEIADLEANQREITKRDTEPTDSDKKDLFTLQGNIDTLNRELEKAHDEEVAVARLKSQESPNVDPLNFAGMLVNSEMNIQFQRDNARPEGNFRGLGLNPSHIKEARAALSSITTPGSVLVPEEWHRTVESYRFERNFLRAQGARVITTASTHNIPVLTALTSPAIVGENVAYTDSDPTWENVVLNAYKLTNKMNVSEELIADTIYDLDSEIARAVGQGFGAAEEELFLVGTGSSQPTGIFNKAADQTLAGGSAVTNDELIDIVYGLARHYRDGAIWMMNDLTAAEIAKAKLTVTTSGTLPYFWTDSVGGEPPRLLGYPVFTHSSIAVMGTGNKSIGFGNPEWYLIGERGPFNIKRLQLNEYSTTFAWHQRIDGKPLDPSAFEIADNT